MKTAKRFHAASPCEPPSPAEIHTALCVLMTQFNSHRCPRLAQVIVGHLLRIADHPELAAAPAYRDMYRRLADRWQQAALSLRDPRDEKRRTGVLH